MFLLRFDMRAPGGGTPPADLYDAALDMASWSESRGALLAVVCEHHSMRDGYLPSPLLLATGLAARTTSLAILTAVVVLPLYDPIRLAEDMTVLDIISRGRVSHVLAIGYRPEEYEHLGADFHRRGIIADQKLELVLKAKTGEPFEHDGRRIHVTPAPFTPGGPRIAWGGGSTAAARRAGRHGLDFFAQGGGRNLEDVYRQAALAAGRTPASCMVPSTDMLTAVFVAHDVDEAWRELGPFIMHDVLSYAELNRGDTDTASLSTAATVEELRAEGRSHRIITVDEAVGMIHSGTPLPLHPLIGGLPPDIAWRYLRIVTDDVMARL